MHISKSAYHIPTSSCHDKLNRETNGEVGHGDAVYGPRSKDAGVGGFLGFQDQPGL